MPKPLNARLFYDGRKRVYASNGKDVLEVEHSPKETLFHLARGTERQKLTISGKNAVCLLLKKDGTTKASRPMEEREIDLHSKMFGDLLFERYPNTRKEFFPTYAKFLQKALEKASGKK